MDDTGVRFDVLGSVVRLICPTKWTAALASAYERFRIEEHERCEQETVVSYREGDRCVALGERRMAWIDSFDGPTQLYNHFLTAILDGVPDHAVLHAAALVDHRGSAFLLAAPSGCGKSSLTLGLLERGYRFLSDDAAPLDPERGTIAPYPRRLALRASSAAPFSDRIRELTESPERTRWLDKILLDPALVAGEAAIARTAKPLAKVFLLEGAAASSECPAGRFVFVAKANVRERWRHAFDHHGMIRWQEDQVEGDAWLARLEHPADPTVIEKLDRWADDPATIFSQKLWTSTPDFSSAPRLESVPICDTSLILGREWLNRRSRSVFLNKLPGGLVEGFFRLAGGLAEAKAYRLQVGRFEETLDCLESCLED